MLELSALLNDAVNVTYCSSSGSASMKERIGLLRPAQCVKGCCSYASCSVSERKYSCLKLILSWVACSRVSSMSCMDEPGFVCASLDVAGHDGRIVVDDGLSGWGKGFGNNRWYCKRIGHAER